MEQRFVSQDFLGENSPSIFESCRIGIIGLSGGGSHVAQQTAHVGIGDFLVIDFDRVAEKNLNRMVWATSQDAQGKSLKTAVISRGIKQVNPRARVSAVPKKWQEAAELLRDRHVIFGCVDSFSERQQIEAVARRYLIPYIDVGMDVWPIQEGFSVGGQVALSMPGGPCLRCLGILTDDRLAQEAAKYGAAGNRPQVVWANGVLASTAVGVFVNLICPWRSLQLRGILREYDGDSHTVATSNKLPYLASVRCAHFSGLSSVGDPFWN